MRLPRTSTRAVALLAALLAFATIVPITPASGMEPPSQPEPSGCDYSAAAANDGWGWNPATGTSCAPLTSSGSNDDPPSSGCDYSAATANGGWGWNPTTGTSCAPSTNSGSSTESSAFFLPRLLSGVRYGSSIVLEWTTDDPTADYVIVRNGVRIAVTDGRSYTDSVYDAEVSYKYAVYARRGGVTMRPRPPLPPLPPFSPTIELAPGSDTDVGGAPATPAEQILQRLNAIDSALISFWTGSPIVGSSGEEANPYWMKPWELLGKLFLTLLTNPTASAERDATAFINTYLATAGSVVRVPYQPRGPGSTVDHQAVLEAEVRSDIQAGIRDFRSYHGRYPDRQQTLAIIVAAVNKGIRSGMSTSRSGYDPGSSEAIAEEWAGGNATGGEYGGTPTELPPPAPGSSEAIALAVTGDRNNTTGEFGGTPTELDSDGDGVPDSRDQYPNDRNRHRDTSGIDEQTNDPGSSRSIAESITGDPNNTTGEFGT